MTVAVPSTGPSGPIVTTAHKWLNHPDQAVGTYNCFDTRCTAEGFRMLRQVLQANAQWDYYTHHVVPFVPVVWELQRRGLRVDVAERDRLRAEVREELADTEATIRTYASCPYTLNLNSPTQRAVFLYDEVGFRVPPPTHARPARSTNQESLLWILKHLRKSDPRELLDVMFHRSRLNTILTRYLSVRPAPDGRVRPRIKVTGTETGRLAYADPAIQQWPREIRTLLVPAPDHLFIAADYSQIEARILAILADDTTSLEVFRAGGDVHAANARDLFALTPAAWDALDPTVREEYRTFAKTFLYGISYGGSPETMHTKLFCPCPRCVSKVPPTSEMPKAAVADAATRWFAKHGAVVRWRDALAAQVRRLHHYTNPFGRRRYFCEPYPTFLRPLYNAPMQSTAAEIINDAMVRLAARGAPIVLQHHDMLMVEVPRGDAAAWHDILREEMERPVPELAGTVFPVDMKQGEAWGRMDKVR